MRIFSLYFPLLLSFLSFLDSIINSIKKHVHSLIGFATAINTTRNIIATDEHKLHLKSHRPISASATTHMDEFMSSTESLGFDSIDERQVNDHVDHEIHHDNDNDDDDDDDDEEEELVGEIAEQTEEEMMVDSDLEEEEIEEDRVGEWNYGMGSNEGFRRCHQVMNPCYHGSHQNLRMYGLGIA
ncbi:PREDICTED: histone chaperone RTT106-like [Lupinus angustifolius]|uniref:histone chaperone RTT106-like n=1 Tax=Lupinus angustifolius TaxID=3871 RepID=UPI00092F54C5|nr:PREDICTED: histone chaperone RTT106-like [Lupinus angustifolius]